MSSTDFYRAFEERHRGPRKLIRSRLQVYQPFITPLLGIYQPANAIDLGCGRGEWLELLQDTGFAPQGVDLDAGMLAACNERGLPVTQGDALSHLQSLDDASQCIVSGFHIAEHLTFDHLKALVQQAFRVLKAGGLLILETPNPENLVVGASNFYLDPTHLRPLPPPLLSFLPEYHGFARVRTLRLQEQPELRQRSDITLMDVLGGVSPDYAVVAQKAAAPDVMERFDTVFDTHYGIDLNDLAGRYDGTLQQRMVALNQRLANAEAQAGGMTEALGRISSLQDRLLAASIELTRKEAECEDLQSRITQFSAQAETAEQHAQAMSVRAQDAENRVQSMQSSLIEANEHLDATSQELHQVHQVHQVHQANHHHWQQWEAVKRELEATLHANHHHWQLAETRQQNLAAVYNSWSWRVTAPLRLIGGLVLHPVATARAGANKFVHYSINTFQRPLSRLMAAVLRRPQLSYRINQWLLRYPALYQQLLGVARQAGVVPGGPVPVQYPMWANHEKVPKLASLTPHARQIYADLKTAIQHNKKAD